MKSVDSTQHSFNFKGLLFTKYLWGFYISVLLFLGTILLTSLWFANRQVRSSAYAETHSIAVALDEITRRQMEIMAIPLEYLSTKVVEAGGIDKIPLEKMETLLEYSSTIMQTADIRGLFVVGRDGMIRGSSMVPYKNLTRYGFRDDPDFDYIKTQRSYVLASGISPLNHAKVLLLLKPLRGKDGRFEGLVGVSKSLEDFEKLHGSLNLPFGMNISIFRDDGKIIYRYPDADLVEGQKISFSSEMQSNSEGYLQSISRIDGQEKIGYYKFVNSYGSLIYVGYNTSAIFAGWKAVSLSLIGVFFLFMAALGVLVRLAQRRQNSIEKARLEQAQREDLTRKIQATTEILTGRDFLRELALQISRVFEINNVAIGVLLPEHSSSVKFVVNFVKGELGTEYTYDLRNTPFEDLNPGEFFVYPRAAGKMFSKDPLLSYREIESCMGIILQDSEQRAIGVLMVYGEKEMDEISLKRSVLSVFAARAGAELERVRTDEIRKEVERLRRQIEERSLQSEKLEAIGTLAEGVAHDFNNILAIILASAEKMISLHREFPQDQHYLESIKKACHRARHLVSQILVFSRKEETSLQPVTMKSIVSETMDFLRATLPAQIRLNIDLNGCGELKINADFNQIQQALMNLCVSASRAIGFGGGEIRISLKRAHIKERAYVKWIIHHNGESLEREEMEKLFDPFYAQNLGMVAVQKIITNHQGFIEVKSEVGQGTDFEVFFPTLCQPEVEEIKSTPYNFKSARKVMIVDDEPEIGLLIKELLEIEGLQVDSFSDPLQAMKVFTELQNQYFLIISDLSMPGMSGFEFARKVREMNKQISLVLWSGYHQFLDEELQDLNVKVLSKPVDVQKLLMLIHAELSQRSSPDVVKEVPVHDTELLRRT